MSSFSSHEVLLNTFTNNKNPTPFLGLLLHETRRKWHVLGMYLELNILKSCDKVRLIKQQSRIQTSEHHFGASHVAPQRWNNTHSSRMLCEERNRAHTRKEKETQHAKHTPMFIHSSLCVCDVMPQEVTFLAMKSWGLREPLRKLSTEPEIFIHVFLRCHSLC